MSCTDPIYALKLCETDGKTQLRILSRYRVDYDYLSLCEKYGKDNIIQLPCGKCDSCIQTRSKTWAARCVLESKQYKDNCFITLTYDQEHYPGKLVKRDLQLFFKRLRKKYGDDIKYFACGEYGSITHRAHYHAIVFNWKPEDLRPICPGKYTGAYSKSYILDGIWKNGITEIGEVSFQSCAYVARYCLKKLKNNVDKDEFVLMSKGIGKHYFDSHIDSICETDLIYGNFGNCKAISTPRYFDKLLDKIDNSRLRKLKDDRLRNANFSANSEMLIHGIDKVEKLNIRKGELKAEQFKKLQRKGV